MNILDYNSINELINRYESLKLENIKLKIEKELPSPVVGMWVVKNGSTDVRIEVIILHENGTGFAFNDETSYIKSDLTWNYNKENLLKIKIPYLRLPEGLGGRTTLYFINPSNCCNCFIDCVYWSVHESDTIETFVPKKRGYDRKIKKLSIIDPDFMYTILELFTSNNLYFFEHIIKILKYMNKGVYENILNFDNPDNMIKSIKFLFNAYDGKNQSNYKELMKIIDRIPEMDIF